MAKKQLSLLESFIGEHVIIFISEMVQTIMSEEGPVEMPLIAEGFVVDVDSEFLLLANEDQTNMSLVNLKNIVKMDMTDGSTQDLVPRPNKKEMN